MFSPEDDQPVETDLPASPVRESASQHAVTSARSRLSPAALFASPSTGSTAALADSDSMQVVNVADGPAAAALSASDSAVHVLRGEAGVEAAREGQPKPSSSSSQSAISTAPQAALQHPSLPSPSTAQPASSPSSAHTVSFAIPVAAPIPRTLYKLTPPAAATASLEAVSAAAVEAPPARPRNEIAHSAEFVQFKANIPLTRVTTSPSCAWQYYDIGPKEITPVVLLHGTSGTPAVFFHQLLALSSRGYRVISASWPPYFSVAEFTAGFLAFLDALHIQKAHLVGCSLGGFLSLCLATAHPQRVDSLVLINAFIDTTPFAGSYLYVQSLYWLPLLAVKSLLLQSFPAATYWPDTVDFVIQQLDELSAVDISSRLTLNSTQHTVPQLDLVDQSRVTIIAPNDDVTLPEEQRERLLAALPNARIAYLKHGGDFPFVSVADEVNMLIVVHLRAVGCFPLPVDEQHKQQDVGPERHGQSVHTPAALDGLKEPRVQPAPAAAAAAAALPAAPARPGAVASKSGPLLFKPERRVLEGGGGTSYEAGVEELDEEDELKRKLAAWEAKEQEKGTRMAAIAGGRAPAAVPGQPSPSRTAGSVAAQPPRMRSAGAAAVASPLSPAEEERRLESLRLQAEVETRLAEERLRAEDERTRRQLEAERRKQRNSAAALDVLMDGRADDDQRRPLGKPAAVFED